MANLKTATINVRGKNIEMFILENVSDVNKFFKEKHIMNITTLKDAFKLYVAEGEKVILDMYTNLAGFYSWRIVGKDDFTIVEGK